jgi:hypothetical protein
MKDQSLVHAKIMDVEKSSIQPFNPLGTAPDDEAANGQDMKDRLKRPLFKYRPLNRETREIRVIVLQPSPDTSADPVCDIYHVPLSHEYFALSYVWGDPHDTRPITLNNQTINITANLELALRHIRHPENPMVFWIDALCLNQCDIEERNHEVGQMRDIYASALLVVAWIGPQLSDREAKAFELIRQLAERYTNDERLVTRETSEWIVESMSPEFRCSYWLPLLEVLERPWFSRVWVVQEVVVSRYVQLQCGALRIDYEEFQDAIGAMFEYILTIAKAPYRELTDMDRFREPERAQELLHLLTRLGQVIKEAKPVQLSMHERKRLIPPLPSFYDIVRRYNTRQATDPRDVIFALLGLADESHREALSIITDYAAEPKNVFLRMVYLHIDIHQDLEPLFDCCGPDRPDDFPSWLPHWKARWNPNPIQGLQVGSEIEFGASRSSEIIVAIAPISSILKIEGISIDTIQEIGVSMDQQVVVLENGAVMNAAFRYWPDLVGFGTAFYYNGEDDKILASDKAVALSDYIRGNLTKLQAFMRLALMDPHSDLDVNNYFTESQNILATGLDVDDHEFNVEKVVARLSRCCLNRRFFVTEQGYMGLSFPETRVGDIVCVFPGLEVPFIVRPDGEYYLLVGEAYVQGLMDGEAMQDLDAGLVQLQTFELH